MKAKIKKCYSAENNDGGTELVWHRHGMAAKRYLAMEIGCDFDEVADFKRRPEFDSYAETEKVPDEVLLSLGWWLTCQKRLCDSWVFEESYKASGNQVICDECNAESLKGEDNAG